MKKLLKASFRTKLLYGFLLIGIIPLFACTFLMLSVFKIALISEAQESAAMQIAAISEDTDRLFADCEQVMVTIGQSSLVINKLKGKALVSSQDIYGTLYNTCAQLRSDADFSVYDINGTRLYSTAMSSASAFLSTDWGILYAAKTQGGVVYRSVYTSSQNGNQERLRSALAIKSDDNILGYVVMSMRNQNFERLLNGKYGQTGNIAILNSLWQPIYCSNSVLSDQLLPLLRTQILRGLPLSDSSNDYIYQVRQNDRSGLFILIQQLKPLVGKTLNSLFLIAGVMMIFSIFMCIAFAAHMSDQFFQPVKALNDAMSEVENGNLDVRIENDRTDELGQLAGRFNHMVKRLKRHLAESLGRQKQLNDARIRMMQAQLNPHFLYNTLDTIKWMGKINAIPEIATIATDLADVLRQSISSKEFVTLREELNLLERYVEIQKIRFRDKFEYEVAIDDALKDICLPKLLLQPLVENAIIHGFEDCSGGHILLEAQRVVSDLVITVSDDGCGMSEESIERFLSREAPTKSHLGLYNIDAILRMNYGEDRGLKIVQANTQGTSIRMTIPIV
ncbi:cache domain-containing sensor histidine kinase [Oscillospiraceae bacterium LTW-04]|nr:sensor histidine kinase [Oscillospiraceae bacterium MB24-C1]